MPIDVWFVLPPDLVLLDFAGPAEAFLIAAAHGGEFRVRVAAAEAAATTSIGVTLGRIEPLPATLRAEDLLIVCGSTHDAAALASKPGRALVRWLREVGTVPKRFACVCAGALFAARAGLLDGRRCTTHHLNIDALRAEAPAAQVLDSRVFVEDRGFYTSAGITAGIDLALHLIAELASPQLSVEVARHMVVYLRRAPDDAALSPWLEGRNHMDPGIHRAQDALARRARGLASAAPRRTRACQCAHADAAFPRCDRYVGARVPRAPALRGRQAGAGDRRQRRIRGDDGRPRFGAPVAPPVADAGGDDAARLIYFFASGAIVTDCDDTTRPLLLIMLSR